MLQLDSHSMHVRFFMSMELMKCKEYHQEWAIFWLDDVHIDCHSEKNQARNIVL